MYNAEDEMSTPEGRRAMATTGAAGTEADGGRARQRRRTRAAIVQAAAELLRAGAEPSVGEIADAADVSRRTVYLYFPNLDQLLLDATIGLLSQADVDAAIDAADTEGDPADRVEAMVRALFAAADDTLPYGRSLLRLTVTQPAEADDGDAPRRGYRRVGWIERALEPLRPQLSAAAFERLVSALAMVVGWEALIVLRDIRGLDADAQLDTTLWTARTLIQAALAEA
jgi:AcrR family transcriptional regulator